MNDSNPTLIERIHGWMRRVPRWIFTIVCMLAILYLTLMPDPLGEEKIPLFPGADKIAHALMFFGLTLCMLFDYMRSHGWKKPSLPRISLMSLIGMGIGIGIEYIQRWMALGRGFETADMVADAAGAIAAGMLWTLAGGVLQLTDAELQALRDASGQMKGSSELREK